MRKSLFLATTALRMLMPLPPTNSQDCLRDLRWKKRVLLLQYAPTEQAAACTQLERFTHLPTECADRDLVLLDLSANQVHLDADMRWNPKWSCAAIEEVKFSLRLIGKDGTEKMTFNEPILPAIIFERIDQMPMRKAEMRNR